MYDLLNAGAICTRMVTIAYPSMALNEAAWLMRGASRRVPGGG